MSDYGAPPPPPPESQGPGQFSGMESMPTDQPPPPPAPVDQPSSIATAVKLMYLGAVLGVIGMLATVLMRDTIRDALQKASDEAATPMSSSAIDAGVAVAVTFGIVGGLIGVGLWLWMAYANGRGHRWARIVATVLFVVSVLMTLGSLVQHPPALSLVVGLVSLAVGAYTIFLLYRPESTRFYDAHSAPRA